MPFNEVIFVLTNWYMLAEIVFNRCTNVVRCGVEANLILVEI